MSKLRARLLTVLLALLLLPTLAAGDFSVGSNRRTLVPAGGTGASVPAVGVLHVDTTSQATTGTIEEVLKTYTLPANVFSANGKGVRVTWILATAANANSKIHRLRVGGLAGDIGYTSTTTLNNGSIYLTALIVRTGSNAQIFLGNGATGVPPLAMTHTDTAPIDIVVTGLTATAAGDVIYKGMLVEILN